MSKSIRTLTNADTESIRTLLNQDPVANLYLRDLLDRQGVDYFGLHRWLGAFDDGVLIALNVDIACTLPNTPCKLSVPVGNPNVCVVFGEYTASQGGSERIMSTRQSSEAFWQGLGFPEPIINHPQHVMSIHQPSEGDALSIRPATKSMLPDLIESTALMRLEDEGIDPRKHDYGLWQQTIEVLIAQRRIWVATEQGKLAFVIEIGTRCSKGTQIGSTYVPPQFRGQGFSTKGMRAIVNHLLQDTEFVSLLVNEGNSIARKCYERVGFQYGSEYQLLAFTP
jgi:hypothetical protein